MEKPPLCRGDSNITEVVEPYKCIGYGVSFTVFYCAGNGYFLTTALLETTTSITIIKSFRRIKGPP
jgi:hypothetical protein